MAGEKILARGEMLWLEGDEVFIHPDAQAHPAFIELKDRDKRGGKMQYQKWLRYLYDAYKKEHAVYRNTLPTQRKRNICQGLASDPDIWKEWDNMMADCIRLYNDAQHTPVENMIRKLVIDMDNYIEQLQDTKWTKTVTKEVNTAEGTRTETFEEIDIKRKSDYLNAASSIIDLADKYKKMLLKEFKENADQGLFEVR
jgi:hypothetical protein